MIEVKNRILTEDAFTILKDLQLEISNGKLSVVKKSGQNDIAVSCPVHKEGRETRPSCFVQNDTFIWHCFTCGSKGGAGQFVSEVMNISIEKAEEWLISKYGGDYTKRDIVFPELVKKEVVDPILDESVLDGFENYHPYMTQRKLTDEVISKFQIKYDPKTECIVFPVRDYKGNLRFLTRRSVKNKKFIIDKDANKKYIYLLNEAKYEREVIIVEGQIDALVSWGYGRPAVALYGAGTTKEQLEELYKTGIKHFILMYDNDSAGKAGAERFKKFMESRSKLVTEIIMPPGKDVADCSKDEFFEILQNNNC